jgi:ferredoxin
MDKFRVNKEKCVGCGACVAVCPFGAIEIGSDGKASINQDKCRQCGKCQDVCPADAIEKKSVN